MNTIPNTAVGTQIDATRGQVSLLIEPGFPGDTWTWLTATDARALVAELEAAADALDAAPAPETPNVAQLADHATFENLTPAYQAGGDEL